MRVSSAEVSYWVDLVRIGKVKVVRVPPCTFRPRFFQPLKPKAHIYGVLYTNSSKWYIELLPAPLGVDPGSSLLHPPLQYFVQEKTFFATMDLYWFCLGFGKGPIMEPAF